MATFVDAVWDMDRNNIFHGNKGVESWLQFAEQIEMCQGVMQKLIDTSTIAKSKARLE